MTATPRRALPGGRTALRDVNDQLAGVATPTLPRRSRPQRAVHCLTTNLCFGCPDDEHRRTGPEFEQAPRRAAFDWDEIIADVAAAERRMAWEAAS